MFDAARKGPTTHYPDINKHAEFLDVTSEYRYLPESSESVLVTCCKHERVFLLHILTPCDFSKSLSIQIELVGLVY